MLFNSVEFLIYLPIVFLCYWFIFRKLKIQNLFIVGASYLFYGWWDWGFLFLILLSTVLCYVSGLAIDKARDTSLRKLVCGANYTKLDRNKLKEDLELTTNSTGIKHKDIPDQNIRYYKKLDKWCQQNNITLVFLNNPMHRSVWCDTTYRKIYSEYFTHIPFIDNTHIELPDSCFADRVHLNTTGARIYTDSLRKQIHSLHISL